MRQEKADRLAVGERGCSLTTMEGLGAGMSHPDLIDLAGHPVFT